MNRFLLAAFLSFVGIVLFAQTPYKTYCNLIGDENSLKKGVVSVRINYGQEDLKDNKFVDENGKEIKFRTMVSAMNFMSKLGWQLEQVYNRIDQVDGSPIIIWVLSKEIISEEEITKGFQTKRMYDASQVHK
ncbi:hypothetical protein [Bacteroides sp. NSJ-48]|jgi:hypothetical protein|uniref:hypothetical protein n=1 Tax=Bacteroides sp. NSJ-48 TaxID=2763020 RepID=UPI00164B4D1A|nr:hypothetical protein [Bacteroides sp. NSJ-48]MBC5610290.1 hypothetical protein [Bacteroides sp. NSJ-48]